MAATMSTGRWAGRASRKARRGSIISASAIGIYPNNSNTVYTELSIASQDSFLGNVVEKWEESVNKFKPLGIKVCKLRTGIVLSKNGGALPEMLKPIKLGLGAIFGNGKQITSWIHIHDLASMYFFAAKNGWEGLYNAVSPHPVSNKEFTEQLALQARRPLFLPNIPKLVMKLILGERHELLFTDANVSAQKAIDQGFTFRFPKLQAALDDLIP